MGDRPADLRDPNHKQEENDCTIKQRFSQVRFHQPNVMQPRQHSCGVYKFMQLVPPLSQPSFPSLSRGKCKRYQENPGDETRNRVSLGEDRFIQQAKVKPVIKAGKD